MATGDIYIFTLLPQSVEAQKALKTLCICTHTVKERCSSSSQGEVPQWQSRGGAPVVVKGQGEVPQRQSKGRCPSGSQGEVPQR